jgi:hypothetical protein
MGPFAVITTYETSLPLVFGHELFEMLADPSGHGREICDRWVTRWFYMGDVPIQDFALPRGGDFCSTCLTPCIAQDDDNDMDECEAAAVSNSAFAQSRDQSVPENPTLLLGLIGAGVASLPAICSRVRSYRRSASRHKPTC